MSQHDERGMATAEYAVGTLGAVTIALVLCRFGLADDHNPWFEAFQDLLERSLGWRGLPDIVPGFGLRL
jgi:hypothetical protein